MSRISPASRLVIAVMVTVVVLLLVFTALGKRGTTSPTATSPGGAIGASDAASAIDTSASASPTAASAGTDTAQPDSAASASHAPSASPTCIPTDQDAYVYNPTRLAVRAACIRVSGRVAAVRTEADGDLHILLALDPAFTGLLTPANQGQELGDLVVEPVCVKPVTQLDAIATCAKDPDPLAPPFPKVGSHVWMEGRYVLDLEHGGWAELHPLYRWAPG